MSLAYNTLVVSDLHLGEDLSPSATEANRLHIDIVERQLVEFLHHYARRREDGRPWRLIVNGDMVDFLAVCVFPDHPAFLGMSASLEDREFGFARTPPVAEVKLGMVIERHPKVFRAFARFLSRGHRVEIISGNHDTEFHWHSTQERFRRGVAEAWESMPEARRPGAALASDLVAGIGFHPWFFHEKGVLWVEHGHQYDECCSFEHQLYPRRPESDQIVTNVDTAGTRFITNYVREADPHAQEAWSALGYLRFGASLGLRGCWRLAKAYSLFAITLLRVWRAGAKSSSDGEEVRRGHLERLRALADSWNLEAERLGAVDELRREPVVSNLRRLARVLMLDKVVVLSVALLVAAVAVLLFDGGIALAAVAATLVAARLVVWWSARHRSIDPGQALAQMPPRILERIDARFVVFGHTHEPVARQLESGAWYFNTGTWVPTGKPGLLRAFTHLVVRHTASGAEAVLCQWRDGASRAFTPGWAPATAPATAPAVEPEPEREPGAEAA